MRVVIVVCGVLLVVLGAGAMMVVAKAQQAPIPVEVPVLDESVMPGSLVNQGIRCTMYVMDARYSFCRQDDLTLVVVKGVVTQSSIDTTDHGLRVGQVISEWGTPIAADYSRFGTVAVYWHDRYIYVVPNQAFSPNSPVNSVTYSSYRFDMSMHNRWHGFVSGNSH